MTTETDYTEVELPDMPAPAPDVEAVTRAAHEAKKAELLEARATKQAAADRIKTLTPEVETLRLSVAVFDRAAKVRARAT